MASMLIAYAKAIDETFERTRGLEKGMAVRDEHIASVEADKRRLSGELAHAQAALQASQTTLIQRDARVAALEASLSWRITRPLRMVADALARFARRR
jgi:hypothetical protein